MNKPNDQKIYEFENFRLDAAHLLLYCDGQEIPLAPKVVETLLALIEARGEIVCKDELISRVWSDTAVEEGNLSQNLFRLRKVLGETTDGKPFIETLRRRGFRFVPEVRITERTENIPVNLDNRLSDVENRTAGFPLNEKPFASEANLSNDFAFQTQNRNDLPKISARKFSGVLREMSDSRRVLLGGFAALLIAASLGFALRFAFDKQTVSGFRELNLKRLTENGNLSGASISADGKLLAYVLQAGKTYSLRLKNIETESEIVVVAPIETRLGSPRFSPDGNFLYHCRGNEIFQIPIFGGVERKIASDTWSNFSVSPDGRQIAFPRASAPGETSSIIVAETDGSGERVAATKHDPDYFVAWGVAPAFSPDGERLTAATGKHGEDEARLVEINLQNGAEGELETRIGWEEIKYLNWASANELLIAGQKKGDDKSQIWSVRFPDGAIARITNDFNDYIDFGLSADKRKIVATQVIENVHLWLFDSQTGDARQITSGTSRADGRFGLAFAPDNRIVFSAREKNIYDIFSVNSDGSDLRQLTKNAGRRNADAVVSPDNQFIVFASDRTGESRLWRMNFDGSDARQLTGAPNEKADSEASPYFSADGRWIYYVFYQSGKGSIRRVSAEGNETFAVSLTDKNVFEPVPSPDGKFLAHAVYNAEAKKPWQIALTTLDGSTEPERFFNFPAFRLRVRWSLDSNSVVSVEDAADNYNLWQTDLTSGKRKPITNFAADKIYRFDCSPDRRFYALSRGNYFYDAVLIER